MQELYHEEMQQFVMKTKAQIVFDKCLKCGKVELAYKIARKYDVKIPRET